MRIDGVAVPPARWSFDPDRRSGAKCFYHLAQRGDAIQITGSSRRLDPANGWGYWQLAGSALGHAVTTAAQAATTGAQGAPAPARSSASPTPGHD